VSGSSVISNHARGWRSRIAVGGSGALLGSDGLEKGVEMGGRGRGGGGRGGLSLLAD
jgi:hypothetical protein